MIECVRRQFWRLRGQDEIKRLLATEEDVLRRTKFKRVQKVIASQSVFRYESQYQV